jgi:hypothetical protein
MSQLTINAHNNTQPKFKKIQSKLIQELAWLAVSCIKNRIRKRKSTLVFRHFIMNCLARENVSIVLKDRFKPTRFEINVAMIAITLYQSEVIVGGIKQGKFFKDFLNECMILEDISPEICKMYGLTYDDEQLFSKRKSDFCRLTDKTSPMSQL